ncbi:hypothetical protein [Streptococcus cuniculipharyngis]|uniref:DUF551 domain-containing protein n=1 Tax=Streptococcus cuniculipharyngis TaxID=1562651 RepID=A0A5C5SED6_9STRE|nr:hypothetical protein [Streptococcus cuniculipharyngis]TWS99159.1 hypothetical protein FRX57_02875 [Streptococcus cuniculipharyngis]
MEWIEIKTRPLTDEEEELYPFADFMFDCPVPDVFENVLVTLGDGRIEVDMFDDYGYSGVDFSEYGGIVIAWKPLPKPFRKET